MKIFVTGQPRRLSELKAKLGDVHEVFSRPDDAGQFPERQILEKFDLLFDLNFDDDDSRLPLYGLLFQKPVIVSAVKKTLKRMHEESTGAVQCHLIGINALPTFINRPKVEVSFAKNEAVKVWDAMANKLGWEYLSVKDETGMVTPRVIAMIINEACFTLEEQTASMDDIDLAMKLGTNYPYGPFEWCDRIGIKDVYETLSAIAAETGDTRYRISKLLEDKYRENVSFYKQDLQGNS